jgi:hypothetical protein
MCGEGTADEAKELGLVVDYEDASHLGATVRGCLEADDA